MMAASMKLDGRQRPELGESDQPSDATKDRRADGDAPSHPSIHPADEVGSRDRHADQDTL